jgi:hypothetical protein
MKLTNEEKMARKEARKEAKRQEKEIARIEAEKNQKPVKKITISIEWVKSRMWGTNPHADASVEYQDGTYAHKDGYTTSGCGYDKESTVIADVFNDFLKYRLWEELPTEKKYYRNGEKYGTPYGVSLGDKWRYYDGGIGTSCYEKISEYIGGTWEHTASGKSFDVFTFTMQA